MAPPKRFRSGAHFIVGAYGLLVMMPVLISMLVISVLRFGPLTFLLPLGAIAFATLLLPCGFGNPFIRRLVRQLKPADAKDGEAFVVQLTLTPRLRSGVGAVLEDADDVGWLSFTTSELRFQGDSSQLSVPFEQIRGLRARNIGWRGLFVYGSKVTFSIASLPQVRSFQFAERSSYLLPQSRRETRRLLEQFRKRQEHQSLSSP